MGAVLLNNMDNEREKWRKQKCMGKKKFILIYGGLLWGGGSIVYSILTIFFNPNKEIIILLGYFLGLYCMR